MSAWFRSLPALLLLLAAPAVVFAAPADPVSMDAVQQLFYNGRYAEAAEQASALPLDDDALAVYELRTTTELFRVRRAIGEPADRGAALRNCGECPALLESFRADFDAGRRLAKATLAASPGDVETLFLLGKLDLNFVWLHLGTLGRRTGWSEYWEARHSLDAALAKAPQHQRARVARAWIDFIVDTRTPWGTAWLLGGGSRKRALAVMRSAADTGEGSFAHAEALFGLWDMQVRDKDAQGALRSAHRLAALFPENAEVARFIRSGGVAAAAADPTRR